MATGEGFYQKMDYGSAIGFLAEAVEVSECGVKVVRVSRAG